MRPPYNVMNINLCDQGKSRYWRKGIGKGRRHLIQSSKQTEHQTCAHTPTNGSPCGDGYNFASFRNDCIFSWNIIIFLQIFTQWELQALNGVGDVVEITKNLNSLYFSFPDTLLRASNWACWQQ